MGDQLREKLRPGDQDWEALLNEQEKFLAQAKGSNPSTKVHRKPAPSVNGNDVGAKAVNSSKIDSIPSPPPSSSATKEENKAEATQKKNGPFRSTKIVDRHAESVRDGGAPVLKPMLAPMPMKFGRSSFPTAIHRSMGGPKLGRKSGALSGGQDQNETHKEKSSSLPEMTATHSNKPITPSVERSGGGGGGGSQLNALMSEINESNLKQVSAMSPEEVAAALEEIQGMFSQESLSFLKSRGEKKLGVPPSSAVAPPALHAQDMSHDGLNSEDRGKKAQEEDNENKRIVQKDQQRQIEQEKMDISRVKDAISLKAATETLSDLEKTKLAWTQDMGISSNHNSSFKTAKFESEKVKSEFAMKQSADENGQRFDLNGWPIVVLKSNKKGKAQKPLMSTGDDLQASMKEEEDVEEEEEEDDDNEIPVNMGLHHHGLSPEAAGYTIDELCVLARSLNPSQRLIATSTLAKAIINIRIILSHLSSCHAQLQQFGQNLSSLESSSPVAELNQQPIQQTPLQLMKNFARWMQSLKPLRLPVQLPSLACDLLSDSSIAVRGEACLLALALSNENHSLNVGGTEPSKDDMSSSDPNFESWRVHLGLCCSHYSPFRRLVPGQAAIAKHAESNLREVFWDPIRREEEEKDDKEDEQHKLMSIFEERIDSLLGADEEDAQPDESGTEGAGAGIEVGSQLWEEVTASPASLSRGLGSMFSSQKALKHTALKNPLKSLLFQEMSYFQHDEKDDAVTEKEKEQKMTSQVDSDTASYNIASKNLIRQGFVGRCVFAIITPGIPAAAVDDGLECLESIANMSKHAAEKIATSPSLMRVLKERFLSPSLQAKGPASSSSSNLAPKRTAGKIIDSEKSWWWHAAKVLKLFRVMCSMSREVCLLLAQDGTLEMVKSFLALSPPTHSSASSNESLVEVDKTNKGIFDHQADGLPTPPSLSLHHLKEDQENKKRLGGVVLEVLRLWRVSLSYGIDLESLPTILQLGPPPSSMGNMKSTSSFVPNNNKSKESINFQEKEEEDDDDDDGLLPDTQSSLSLESFFHSSVFLSTFAVALPLCARFVHLFGPSSSVSSTPPRVKTASHEVPQEVNRFGLVDSLCSALLLALEEAIRAWHDHSMNHKRNKTISEERGSQQDDENEYDEVTKAALKDLGYENHIDRKGSTGGSLGRGDVSVSDQLLDMCGSTLIKIGEVSRQCLLSVSNIGVENEVASFDLMELLLMNNEDNYQLLNELTSLRIGSAMACFLSTFTSIGRIRAIVNKREQELKRAKFPTSSQAFFVPPPPTSIPTSSFSSGLEATSLLEARKQKWAVTKFLVSSTQAVLHQPTSLPTSVKSSGSISKERNQSTPISTSSSNDDDTKNPLSRARAITSIILKEASQLEVVTQMEIRSMNTLTCALRLYACVYQNDDNAAADKVDKAHNTMNRGKESGWDMNSESEVKAQVQLLVSQRIDTFVKQILFNSASDGTPSAQRSNEPNGHFSSMNRTPIHYRYGHTGRAHLAWRRRAGLKKLLLSSSCAVLNLSSDSQHETFGRFSSSRDKAEVSVSSDLAIEWLAFAIPLFETGQEIDAKIAIETYLNLQVVKLGENFEKEQDLFPGHGANTSELGNEKKKQQQIKMTSAIKDFKLLSNAYTESLESFFEDTFHAQQLSGECEFDALTLNDDDLGEETSLSDTLNNKNTNKPLNKKSKSAALFQLSKLASCLSRTSCCLLPHGNQFLCSVAFLVARCLSNSAKRHYEALLNGKVSFQNDRGEEQEDGIIHTSLSPALSVQLPLPTHWLALPLLINVSEGMLEACKIVQYREPNVQVLLRQEFEKHLIIKMSIYLLNSLSGPTITENNSSDSHDSESVNQSKRIMEMTNHVSLASPGLLLLLITKHIMNGEYQVGSQDHSPTSLNAAPTTSSLSSNWSSSKFATFLTHEEYMKNLFNLFKTVINQCLPTSDASNNFMDVSSSSSSSSSNTGYGGGFGDQLLSHVLSVSPPSAMDRIEALAATKGMTMMKKKDPLDTSRNGGEDSNEEKEKLNEILAPYTNKTSQLLPNITLEKLTRVIIQQFAQSPPPMQLSTHSSTEKIKHLEEKEEEKGSLGMGALLRHLLRCMLRCDVPASTRAVIWKDLAQLQMLHLLAEDWAEGEETSRAFLNPIDEDPHVLAAYVAGIVSMSNRPFFYTGSQTKASSYSGDSGEPAALSVLNRPPLSFLWVIALNHLFKGGKVSGATEQGGGNTIADLEVTWGEKKRLGELLAHVGVDALIQLFEGWISFEQPLSQAQYCMQKLRRILEEIQQENDALAPTCMVLVEAMSSLPAWR